MRDPTSAPTSAGYRPSAARAQPEAGREKHAPVQKRGRTDLLGSGLWDVNQGIRRLISLLRAPELDQGHVQVLLITWESADEFQLLNGLVVNVTLPAGQDP